MVTAATWGKPPKRNVTGRPTAEDEYAGTLLEFREWCVDRKLLFREEVLRLVTARMGDEKRDLTRPRT
jgi:hypothetical protein